jgi:TolA-binding protein
VTVVDLHPEDLLEKDAHGLLDTGERARLEAHLHHCVACRMERQLRADFASELDTEVAVERLGLGIEQLPDTLPPRESSMVLRGPRRRRHRAVWLLAAAVLLVGGAAAAAMGLSETRWVVSPSAPSAPANTNSTAATNVKAHRAAVATVAAADLPELTSVEAPAEPTVAAPAVPVVAPSRPRAAPVAAPAVVVGPAELFDTAAEARRRSDYGRSLDLDRELEERYPTSSEAQASRAIVGRLLLDRGDPAGALAKFDSYLASGGGDLGEEAMVGRATALDRLGKADEATRAWSALVAAFPDSPYAARARARLENSNGR